MCQKQYRFKGGKSYSLKELFTGENDKIVIPDLQRDYCWANSENNLVGPFIDNLMELDKSQNITLGLIYGYFNDKLPMPDRLQLCDGQQRITTLFILLGVLNKRLENRYKDLLISQHEIDKDDCEPYLQYSIRESSLYFISDLVMHYFIGSNESCDLNLNNVEAIKKSYWYLDTYNNDPTICSMLQAISTIENKLNGLSDVELRELGDFVSGINNHSHIEFLFYDMKNRTNGEETFVVINTTGDPLSANQNLKPLITQYYKDSIDKIEAKWEEMETWFWQNRDKSSKPAHTSDEGMAEFLRCVRLYLSKDVGSYLTCIEPKDKFPYKDISFERIYTLFQFYKRIYSIDYSERFDENCYYNNANNGGKYTAKQLYILLPTIAYCENFKNCSDEDIKRIYHLFTIMSRYRSTDNLHKDGEQIAPAWNAMKLIQEISKDGELKGDVLSLKDYQNNYFEHERKKLNLIYNSNFRDTDQRKKTESIIASAEQNPIFNGRLKVIIDWSTSIEAFQSYMNKINGLWQGSCNENIDELRRALLTLEWERYPIDINGKLMSLGWSWNNWYDFFVNNDLKVKNFLDSPTSISEYIERFDNIKSPYYAIIKDSQFLKNSFWKNLYIQGKHIVILMQKERASADYCIFFNNEAYNKNILGGNWKGLWVWADLLYCDHSEYDLTVDITFSEAVGYKIYIFSGKYPKLLPFASINEVEQFGLKKTAERNNGWSSEYINDKKETKELVLKIASWVNEKLFG